MMSSASNYGLNQAIPFYFVDGKDYSRPLRPCAHARVTIPHTVY